MTEATADTYWLGPTYEFRADDWQLVAGIPADGGRLEWLLTNLVEGADASSHSFQLDPHATRDDLEAALADLPPEVTAALVAQVEANDPALLSVEGRNSGLA